MKAAFLPGLCLLAACTASSEPEPPAAPCASPAPLSLAKENAIADAWIVMLDDDVLDVRAETDALASRHGFVVGSRLDIVRGFVARTDDQDKIARLRCEKSVKQITQDRRANVRAEE